jgi:superfamily II DNA or RNA helicase
VPDPLLTALDPGPAASPAAIAGCLASCLRPAEDPSEPPPWLYPQQIPSYRRAIAALRRFGGALLADPVGTGKTYVALAIAATLNREPTTCLVPAGLRQKWEHTAAEKRIPVAMVSHQQASKGVLPRSRGLVIIDESHHFRNSRTKRYVHVARWVIGRPVLLVTATPVVNHLRDLANQLLLSIRDDALLLDGIVSLRTLPIQGVARPPLGQLVIETEHPRELRPVRILQIAGPTDQDAKTARDVIQKLQRLRLSPSTSTAALFKSVLLRAASSSPAALDSSLRRYRRLLLHARDAQAAGRPLDRQELRRFTRELGDQLIWWELMSTNSSGLDLDLEDLAVLDQIIPELISTQGTDDKLRRLQDLLSNRCPTLVFTASKDTLRYLRVSLAHLQPAWCTGERAGIGTVTLPRAQVLSWFRQHIVPSGAPMHLFVTDVAAEGLDLQRAARVVHYDLPWTPMRLEQREGRAVRYGSTHPRVEVVRFSVAPLLEQSLGVERALLRKQRLPAKAGLGHAGRHLWRWRAELASRYGHNEHCPGAGKLVSQRSGLLAGFTLHDSSTPARLSASLVWVEADGTWSEVPEVLADRLAEAAAERDVIEPSNQELQEWLTLLSGPIRERLALQQGRRWIASDPATENRALIRRLQPLVRQAARMRQAGRLKRLEQAMGFVARGHTAGEDVLLKDLLGQPDDAVLDALAALPAHGHPPDSLEVRLAGVVVFGCDRGRLV